MVGWSVGVGEKRLSERCERRGREKGSWMRASGEEEMAGSSCEERWTRAYLLPATWAGVGGGCVEGVRPCARYKGGGRRSLALVLARQTWPRGFAAANAQADAYPMVL